MSPRLPVLTADETIKLLSACGFTVVSQKGSHIKMRSAEGIVIIIPNHAGHTIKPGLLKAILRQAGIDEKSVRR